VIAISLHASVVIEKKHLQEEFCKIDHVNAYCVKTVVIFILLYIISRNFDDSLA